MESIRASDGRQQQQRASRRKERDAATHEIDAMERTLCVYCDPQTQSDIMIYISVIARAPFLYPLYPRLLVHIIVTSRQASLQEADDESPLRPSLFPVSCFTIEQIELITLICGVYRHT